MLLRQLCCLAVAFLLSAAAAHAAAVSVHNPSGVRESGTYIDDLLAQSMREQGIRTPRLAGKFPHKAIERVEVRTDAFTEINELFYQRGWTDGLPIVPPTPERVKAMLRGADLSADMDIATLAPMDGVATVEKIAVNAVMAGCAPAHMPVLLAAVEAVAAPECDLLGWSTTTNPDSALLIVSGPIVQELGLNAGTNTFGRGSRPNVCISRAFHLILQNVGGSWPGVTDMSTLGQPGEIAMMLVENTKASPWGPLHATFGYPENANTVIVAPVEGYTGILGIGQSREGYLKLVASWLAGQDRPARHDMLLVIAQDTAEALAKDGWTRERMDAFIRAHAKVPFRVFKEQFVDPKMAKNTLQYVRGITDPAQPVSKPFMDRLHILVAGGTGEKSMIMPVWAAGQAVANEIRLPPNWAELTGKQPR